MRKGAKALLKMASVQMRILRHEALTLRTQSAYVAWNKSRFDELDVQNELSLTATLHWFHGILMERWREDMFEVSIQT